MFEIIQDDKIKYSEKTNRNIEYFKFYLDKCLSDSHYCNNKIFLSCMEECLSLSLPKSDLVINGKYTIEQKCDYTIINASNNEKTDIIFNNKDNIEFFKIYYCKRIEDLFICSMYELFEKRYIIRKCANCNRFFVTEEKGNRRKYCFNSSPQNKNKSCYEYVSQMKSTQNRRNKYVIRLYTTIANRIRTRKERESDDNIRDLYDNEANSLSLKYEQMKKQVKSGEILEKDLINFLEEYNKNNLKNGVIKNGSSRNNKK